MPDYPHLGDTSYPHLGTVQPYRRKVDFDYGRYDYTATIKLCNVTWPSDYRHTVNWQSAEARDSYFASIEGPTIELASGFTHVQLDSVMIPVPLDIALAYNYVYVTVPPLTQGERIDYEGDDGVRTICAFIQGATYHSPSTTELTLQVDQWTTYLPHLATYPVLMLHRGHAPAYATDVDDYLANPRAHCQNLLTPDVSFGVADVAASSTLLPIGAGSKMLVLASSIPASVIADLSTAVVEDGNGSDPTYYDTNARNGHQVGVNGYEWHYGGHSYQGMRNPSGYTGTGGAMPSYLTLYGIPASRAREGLDTLAQRLPQLMMSVQAAYLLPSELLTLAEQTITIAGVMLYRILPQPGMQALAALELSRASFGYPTRYAEIAKLYTSPYARLVVSDALGQEIEVRIEDMGPTPRLVQQISPMAECLRWDVLVTGANSAGTNAYTWRNLSGTDVSLSLPGADVARYTLELGIPTYALYLDARDLHAASGWYDAQAQRASAINSYQSTMRSANTAKANADASADTAKDNADASADTAKENADLSADTNVTNVGNNGTTANANRILRKTNRDDTTTRNNLARERMVDYANTHISDDSSSNSSYTRNATNANLKSEALSTIATMVGQMATGNFLGSALSGASGLVSITTDAQIAGLGDILQGDNATHAKDANRDSEVETGAQASDLTTYENDLDKDTTDNNIANANTNATNSARTAKENARKSKKTAKDNATRSRDTAKSNAGYDRSTTEENAKAALELARLNYNRRGHEFDMDSPARYGSASGDASADALMRRVVQVRIDTQSAGAIARAGDAMLRYGYTYDGLWSVVNWCPTGHDGCYWEASDITAPATDFANPTAERTFEDILTAGVTIWNDPAKIGGVPW